MCLAMLTPMSVVFTIPQEIKSLMGFKEALIKSHLTTWHTSCLQIFRHLARKLLEIRKYSCVAFVQADKKSDGAICAPDLISTSLKNKKRQNQIDLIHTNVIIHIISIERINNLHILHNNCLKNMFFSNKY